MSQPQLEFFSGKNFVKPNAINPLCTRIFLEKRLISKPAAFL